MAKIGQYACAIAQEKWSVWVKNYKCQKGGKNDNTTTLELMCAKSRFKKDLIVKKREHFSKSPELVKGWAHAKWSV